MGDYSRILVVANETAGGRGLRDEIQRLAAPGAVVKVVAPALSSRIEYILSDVDKPRAQARVRLGRSLELLAAGGVHAVGEVGEANPVRAFKDQSAIFEPDVVIVATHPEGRSHWLERGVVEKIAAAADVEVRHVVVDLRAEEAEAKLRAA